MSHTSTAAVPQNDPVASRREGRLALVLVINLVLVAAQVVFGITARSLGLLADAGHNLTDAAAVALSLIAVRWARRGPTERRSFGYHRGTILAAQANAASILAVTLLIGYEATRRLIRPQPVEGAVVVVVASVAALANAASARLLWEKGEDLNMRSALLHMAGDALASVGVAGAGLVIVLSGRLDRLDPAVSLGIGVLIAWQAWKLLRATTDVLLESTPKGLDPDEIAAVMEAVDGVKAVHDLHVWSLSSEVRALSAHVVLAGHPTLEEAQEVGIDVKRAITMPYRIAHATFELECEHCVDDGSWCPMGDLAAEAYKPRAPHHH